MKIIDVRCRYTGGITADYYRAQLLKSGRLHLIEALKEGTEAAFFAELDRAGVDVAVSASGFNPGATLGKYDLASRTTPNDFLAEIQSRHPKRFVAVGGLDVSGTFHDPMEEIEKCQTDYQIKVFNIEPGRAPAINPSDEQLFPVYERLEQMEATVIVQTSGLKGGTYLNYAHPDHIEIIAEHFPGLHIICAHGCYPYVREAIAIAMRRDNIWLSPEGYLWHLGHDDWMRAINYNFEGFAEKFLFGTAYPLTPLQLFVENFLKLPWKPEYLPGILYKNAIKALRLEGTPIDHALNSVDL